MGEVSRTDVPDLLQAADIIAIPSRFEGQSNALLEAMNAGLPIFVSDIPPQAETLGVDGREAAGWLLLLDDSFGWARAIKKLILDSDLQTRMGALARTRVAVFSLERMVDDYEQIIRSSLGLGLDGQQYQRSLILTHRDGFPRLSDGVPLGFPVFG